MGKCETALQHVCSLSQAANAMWQVGRGEANSPNVFSGKQQTLCFVLIRGLMLCHPTTIWAPKPHILGWTERDIQKRLGSLILWRILKPGNLGPPTLLRLCWDKWSWSAGAKWAGCLEANFFLFPFLLPMLQIFCIYLIVKPTNAAVAVAAVGLSASSGETITSVLFKLRQFNCLVHEQDIQVLKRKWTSWKYGFSHVCFSPAVQT